MKVLWIFVVAFAAFCVTVSIYQHHAGYWLWYGSLLFAGIALLMTLFFQYYFQDIRLDTTPKVLFVLCVVVGLCLSFLYGSGGVVIARGEAKDATGFVNPFTMEHYYSYPSTIRQSFVVDRYHSLGGSASVAVRVYAMRKYEGSYYYQHYGPPSMVIDSLYQIAKAAIDSAQDGRPKANNRELIAIASEKLATLPDFMEFRLVDPKDSIAFGW